MPIICLAVFLVLALALPGPVFAAALTTVPAQATGGGFPWLALLILLVPVGIMIYASRGKKEPNIKSGA